MWLQKSKKKKKYVVDFGKNVIWSHNPIHEQKKIECFERINSIRETNAKFDSCNSCNGWLPAVYLSCMIQTFRLFLYKPCAATPGFPGWEALVRCSTSNADGEATRCRPTRGIVGPRGGVGAIRRAYLHHRGPRDGAPVGRSRPVTEKRVERGHETSTRTIASDSGEPWLTHASPPAEHRCRT